MYPEFEEASRQFGAFLERESWPTEVAWLVPEAVTLRGRTLIVHPRRLLPATATEERYTHLIQRGLGVLITAHGHDDQRSYASLWAPKDEFESQERLMPDGLKLAVALPPLEVELTSGLRFAWRRFRGPRRELVRDLLS